MREINKRNAEECEVWTLPEMTVRQTKKSEEKRNHRHLRDESFRERKKNLK
jgi:hypothetical protein